MCGTAKPCAEPWSQRSSEHSTRCHHPSTWVTGQLLLCSQSVQKTLGVESPWRQPGVSIFGGASTLQSHPECADMVGRQAEDLLVQAPRSSGWRQGGMGCRSLNDVLTPGKGEEGHIWLAPEWCLCFLGMLPGLSSPLATCCLWFQAAMAAASLFLQPEQPFSCLITKQPRVLTDELPSVGSAPGRARQPRGSYCCKQLSKKLLDSETAGSIVWEPR